MSFFRRIMYLGTGRVIDIRTDKERLEDYSKRICKERNEAKTVGVKADSAT